MVNNNRKSSTTAKSADKCPKCKATAGDDTISCGVCNKWYHPACQDISQEKFTILADQDVLWCCSFCNLNSLVSELKEIKSLRDSFAELKSDFSSFQKSIFAKIDSISVTPVQSATNFEDLVKVQTEIEERRTKKDRTVLFRTSRATEQC